MNVGQFVKLKVGSVKMVVSAVSGEMVTVLYEESGVVRERELPKAVLEPWVDE